MSVDRDVITQELAALMRAHNRWTARVRRLQRIAAALGDALPEAQAVPEDILPSPPGPDHSPELERLQAELSSLHEAMHRAEEDLQAAQGEREQLRAQAADWEHKARVLAHHITRQRREKESP